MFVDSSISPIQIQRGDLDLEHQNSKIPDVRRDGNLRLDLKMKNLLVRTIVFQANRLRTVAQAKTRRARCSAKQFKTWLCREYV